MIRNGTPQQLTADQFPLTIKNRFARVKIYQSRNRDGCIYQLSYISAEKGRVRKTFTDLERAKDEAKSIAGNLARGDLEGADFRGIDKQIYAQAARHVAHTGFPLESAAREFARCFDILGHGGIVEAARFYKKHVETGLPDVLVADAVERFAAAKQKQGVSKLYLKDIRGILSRRFAEHFRCNIATVGPEDLRAYLDGLKVGAVAKNNHRRMIGALFSFARAEGWLPDNRETAAQRLSAYIVKERDVEIYTPTELARMLANAGKEFLPWVALIAFGGVRNEELAKGLPWEAINFERGYLIIPAGIAKTGRKRKVDLPENLLEWLAPYRDRRGAIFNRDFRKPLMRMCESAKLEWKRNGKTVRWLRNALRHSFGSYRMELVKNAGQVALEMGNSAKVVADHYHEIVEADAARKYWNIRPMADADRKVVAMVGPRH